MPYFGRTRVSPAPVGRICRRVRRHVHGERRSTVGGQRLWDALAEPDRRGSVGPAQVHGVPGSAADALFVEQNRAAVARDVEHPREVEPRELPLLGRARRKRHDRRPRGAVDEQHPSVRGRCPAGSGCPGAFVTVRTRPESVTANTAKSAPIVLSAPPTPLNQTSSPPGDQARTGEGLPAAGDGRLVPGQIDDGDIAAAVDRRSGARRRRRGRPSARPPRRSAIRVRGRARARWETRGCRVRHRSARSPATHRRDPNRPTARSRGPRVERRRRSARGQAPALCPAGPAAPPVRRGGTPHWILGLEPERIATPGCPAASSRISIGPPSKAAE